MCFHLLLCANIYTRPHLNNLSFQTAHIYYMHVFSTIFKEIKGYIKYLLWFTIDCNEEIVVLIFFFFESLWKSFCDFQETGTGSERKWGSWEVKHFSLCIEITNRNRESAGRLNNKIPVVMLYVPDVINQSIMFSRKFMFWITQSK